MLRCLHKSCLLLLLYFLILSPVKAQTPFYFKHYEVEHGLSNNTVLCSVQDKKGFMWFGTIDGLNRFDGYTFKTFRNNPSNKKSIGNNSIFHLYADNDGNLWAGTSKGLFKYDPIEESFTLIPFTENKWVHSINEDAKGNIWLILDNTLSSYNRIALPHSTFFQNRSRLLLS